MENVDEQWLNPEELAKKVGDAHKKLGNLYQELCQELEEGFERLCNLERDLSSWFQQQFNGYNKKMQALEEGSKRLNNQHGYLSYWSQWSFQQEIKNYIDLENTWKIRINNIKQKQGGRVHDNDLDCYLNMSDLRLNLLSKLKLQRQQPQQQYKQINDQVTTAHSLLENLYYFSKEIERLSD